MRLVLETLPTFLRKSRRVTVSPGSMVPLGGAKLSPPGTMLAPAAAKRRNGAALEVVTLALLLAGLGSDWAAETVAETVRDPTFVEEITMVTVARPPLTRVPKLAVSAPAPMEMVPWVVLVETRVTPGGRVSDRKS